MQIELTFIEWKDPFYNYYWCYCLETWSQNHGNKLTVEDARKGCLEQVQWEFQIRLTCKNLERCGWKVSETELIAPVINEQQEVSKKHSRLVEWGHPANFNDYKTIKLLVEIPPLKSGKT